MATFVLKLNCELHLNGAEPRPDDAMQWEGQTVTLPPRITAASGTKVATGDKLIIWTHEDPNFGRGLGLTAVARAGAIIASGVETVAVLSNVKLIKPHVRLNNLPSRPSGSELLDYLISHRHLRTIAVSEAQETDFWSVLNAIEATKQELIADYVKSLPKTDAAQALLRDEGNIAEAFTRRFAETELRPHQGAFRQALIEMYGARCVISRSRVTAVLEAAHIVPFSEGVELRNDVRNGLLLRSDLHILFDRALMTIHPDSHELLISQELSDTAYGKMAGRLIQHHASPELLRRHFEEFSSRITVVAPALQ